MHERKRLRHVEHDYSLFGWYFITICVNHRLELFGSIANDIMHPNVAGESMVMWWKKLSETYIEITAGEFVVMPNHVHGLVGIGVGDDPCVVPIGRTHGSAPTIPSVIQWYKTMTTNTYIRGVHSDGWTRFASRLWQRSFYDRIIRNEEELEHARWYIRTNPEYWERDPYFAQK